MPVSTYTGKTLVEANNDLDKLLGGIPSGRTVATLQQLLANNVGFNPADFPPIDTTGVTSAIPAITLAQAAAAAVGAGLIFTPGEYLLDADFTFTVPVRMLPGAVWKRGGTATVTVTSAFHAHPAQVFSGFAAAQVVFAATASVSECYPVWWGCNGNVAPYDTAAVQAAFSVQNIVPVRLTQNHYVTSVAIADTDHDIDFSGYKLIGVATTATDCVLALQCYRATIKRLHVDQNFNTNYTQTVRAFADSTHPNALQFTNIWGFLVENCVYGFVGGVLPGSTPFNAPMSECTIYGFQTRACQCPVTVNQSNGKIIFVGGVAAVTKNEWSAHPGTFDYSASCSIRVVDGFGEVAWHGGSIENNESFSLTAYGIRGSNIHVHGAIWENINTNLIEGDSVVIGDSLNSTLGGSVSGGPAFTIAEGATGTLTFLGTSSTNNQTSQKVFVDGTLAPAFVVRFLGGDFKGWDWSYLANADAPFVYGCRALYQQTRIRDFAVSYDVVLTTDPSRSRFATADPIGNTMSVTHDLTAKGNWTISGGAGGDYVCGNVVDTPTGLPGSIEFGTVTGQLATAMSPTGTSGFRVTPNDPMLLSAWIKAVANGSPIVITMFWYQYDGTASATPSTEILNVQPSLAPAWANWVRISPLMIAPPDAQFAAIQISTSNTTVFRIADIRL